MFPAFFGFADIPEHGGCAEVSVITTAAGEHRFAGSIERFIAAGHGRHVVVPIDRHHYGLPHFYVVEWRVHVLEAHDAVEPGGIRLAESDVWIFAEY
jgi:hypothetical protein